MRACTSLPRHYILIFCAAVLALVTAPFTPVRSGPLTLADSVRANLPLRSDTVVCGAIMDVARSYLTSKPDSALYFGQKAITMCGACRWIKGTGRAHNIMGITYEYLTRYPLSLRQLEY